VPDSIESVRLVLNDESELNWKDCIVGINQFILSNAQSIRRIEDKQVGWWFIKPDNERITLQQVEGKLMFYLWDNVFAKDRRPLENILTSLARKSTIKLITFADLVKHTEMLMRYFCDGIFF